MRSNINVETLDPIRARNDFNTFKLVFTTDDPRRAQQATRQLADLFINEHVKTLEQQASSTTDFLTRQVEDARRKLTEEEQRLRDFKTRYGGELPEQQQSNFQTLMDFRMQLQTTRTALVQARMQRTSLASSAQTILTRLQFERTNLLNRLTPRHPDVLKKDLEVANVQTVVDELRTGAHVSGRPLSAIPEDAGLAQLKAQVETSTANEENLTNEERRLSSEIARFQARVNLTPIREQQLTSILRDYDQLKQDYTDLQGKQLQSRLAANVEEKGEGQQFSLVEEPNLPRAPSSPPRAKLALGAILAGLVLGIALAFIRDTRDSSLHSEKELRRTFPFPLVVAVPLLLTPKETREQLSRKIIEWSVGCTMAAVVALAEIYVYRVG